MTKIKLCGLRRPADIEKANALEPDFIGFVFAEKSVRAVTAEQAAELKKTLQPGIRAVGVFVNEPLANVRALLKDGVIDLAQLHGAEDEAYIRALREETGAPVIRAFRIREAADLRTAEESSADILLLDAGAGSGATFDWTLLNQFSRPYILAGGLNPVNVQAALKTLHPWGVDVSSGIETDGNKDPAKMEAFVQNVRAAQLSLDNRPAPILEYLSMSDSVCFCVPNRKRRRKTEYFRPQPGRNIHGQESHPDSGGTASTQNSTGGMDP